MARRKSIVHGSEKLAGPPDLGRNRWLVATYRPVSLFSLRMTHATSKGGKTLVVPTPYAVKMALLDASFRAFAPPDVMRKAKDIFDIVKWRDVRIRPPKHCVVQNTFVKILDREREGDLPFKQTIAYREFVFFSDDENDGLSIALAVGGLSQTEEADLGLLFAHINSLGKRGSFLQFQKTASWEGELPIGFTVPVEEPVWRGVNGYGMIQALDDFGEDLCLAENGFDRVSTYGKGTVKLGEHRVLIPTAIPYRRRSAARRFTWYERID
jgi:hypothetical protein